MVVDKLLDSYYLMRLARVMKRIKLAPHTPLIERFWHYTDKRGDDECWPWVGSKGKAGYGQLTVKGKHYHAHRLAFELLVGPIEHRDVCHSCDNRECVNPKHLFNASHSENMKDAVTKGRVKKSEWLLNRMQAAQLKRLKKAEERRLRKEQMLLGLVRQRNNGGQFGDAPCAPRKRDRFGRLIKEGAPELPARQRGANGLFISTSK